MAVDAWDGRPLGEPPISLGLLMSGPSGEGSPPTIAFAAAGSGTRRCVMRPEQIGPFLLVHQGSQIICHDSASFHWAIRGLLGPGPGWDSPETLWAFSREGRLLDARLLDQLLRLARGVSDPPPRHLHELAEEYANITLPQPREMTRRVEEAVGRPREVIADRLAGDAIAVADALLQINRRLASESGRIIADLGVERATVERFGPLGLAVQVRGTIALRRATHNGLHLRGHATPELAARCDEVFRESSRILSRGGSERNCFHWVGDRVRLKPDGSPDIKRDNLRGWLERRVGAIPGLHAIPPEPPRGDGGRIITDPVAWGPWIECDPHLRAWASLITAANVKKALAAPHPGDEAVVLHPRYEVVPRFRSYTPNLGLMKGLDPAPMFVAPAGHALLVVELQDLELRCVAEVIQRRGGEAQLAGWFRVEIDPVERTAARLYDREARDPGDFLDLKERSPAIYAHWIGIASTYLRAVPRGLTAGQVREILRLEYDIDLDGTDAQRHHDYLVGDLLPELSHFLAEDTFEVVRRELGCGVDELASVMIPGDRDSSEAALRNLIAGKTRSAAAFEGLRSHCRSEPWRDRLAAGVGSRELHEAMFGRDVISPIGGVRGRMFFHQARAAEFLDLAGDVMKSALYAVAAAGHEPVGCAGDEFVLRVPDGQLGEELQREVGELALGAAGSLLRSVRARCIVRPVSTW